MTDPNDKLAAAAKGALRVMAACGMDMFWEYSELLAAVDEWERAQVDEAKSMARNGEVR